METIYSDINKIDFYGNENFKILKGLRATDIMKKQKIFKNITYFLLKV